MSMLSNKTEDSIYFVTQRPKKYASETFQLIQRFCPYPFKVAMCDSSDDKYKYLTDYKYFVEDRRRTALQLAQESITVYVPPRSWNKMKVCPDYICRLPTGIEDLFPLIELFVEGA